MIPLERTMGLMRYDWYSETLISFCLQEPVEDQVSISECVLYTYHHLYSSAFLPNEEQAKQHHELGRSQRLQERKTSYESQQCSIYEMLAHVLCTLRATLKLKVDSCHEKPPETERKSSPEVDATMWQFCKSHSDRCSPTLC